MKTFVRLASLLSFTALALTARADFSPTWINDAYWADGKAEFLIYEGTEARYGKPQPAEVIHIFVQENFAPEALVKADDWGKAGAYPVLKLNQIIRVQTGLYVYQQMHSNFWKQADGSLAKWSLTSNDSCGNTWKIGEAKAGGWTYRFETYWEGMVKGEETVGAREGAIFYDELPARVRSLDFSQTSPTKVRMAASVIGSKKDQIEFREATFTHRAEGGRIVVEVAHARGKDTFIVDAKFPHLIREWRAFDGGVLTLKHALKVPYWELNQPGDRERALKDPANQIP